MIFLGMGRPFFFFWGTMMGGGGMMGSYYPYMMGGGYYGIMVLGLELVGIVAGILVIVFAALMKSRPADSKTYGILVIVFSLVSFAGMGGFFIGAIVGLVGGVLATING